MKHELAAILALSLSLAAAGCAGDPILDENNPQSIEVGAGCGADFAPLVECGADRGEPAAPCEIAVAPAGDGHRLELGVRPSGLPDPTLSPFLSIELMFPESTIPASLNTFDPGALELAAAGDDLELCVEIIAAAYDENHDPLQGPLDLEVWAGEGRELTPAIERFVVQLVEPGSAR